MKTMRHSRQLLDKPSGPAFTFPGKQSFFSFLRKLSFLFLFSFFASPSFSNNIRIEGVVSVSESSHSDTLLLSFSLRWDHSWRDEFNWDAAWVFLKYKTASGAWQPVYLSSRGHRFTDASGSALSFGSMEGETDGKTVGLFIYRTTLEGGNTPEIRCHLLCPRSSLGGLPAEAFERNEAFVLAQGIEMVYIPYGAYYVGDSSSFHTIADAVGHPILVDSEEGVSVSAGGSSYTLSASYPKGYKGFYMMKYEVSQEQYVTFLNNLTYTQQQERVPGLALFSSGDYIFGDASRPSSRNGIVVAVSSEGGSPVIFANNLNNDGKYSQADDGKTLPCNYLSPEDMIAYLSWSGLRPMSELEYEKACRAPYPEMPVGREYAWHENSGLNALTTILSSGERTEKSGTAGANVNAGNRFPGPVRCGLFATGSSSQRDAGASFWGVMEMSGNLRELCYNVNAANAFSGDVYGDGTYNKSRWSTVVSHFGVRGGGFSSNVDALRISNRREVSYFSGKSITYRDSTVGFRGVRPIGKTVNPGSLIVKKEDGSAMSYGCLGFTSHIESAAAASVGVSGMNFTYLWYVLEPGSSSWQLISGETDETLDFNRFVNDGTNNVTYQFKRKVICQVGEATSTVLSLTVPNTQIKLILPFAYLDGANAASNVITATSIQTNGIFSWLYNNTVITDGTNIVSTTDKSIYRPSRTHFGDNKLVEGQKPVICRYTIEECSMDSTAMVDIAPYDNRPCTGSITDAEGNQYDIAKIGDQCWMQDNMNIGETSEINGESDYWRYKEPGIQKFCSGDCNRYGGLYEWWEVVCAGHCPGLTTPDMNITQGNYANMEQAAKAAVPSIVMAPDGYHIKGFCPDGWHLPSDEEWKQLEMYLGMSRAQADLVYQGPGLADNWGRQTGSPGQGEMMKSADDSWNGLSTKTNSDDKYCFYAHPHGSRYPNGSSFVGLRDYFFGWSSTPDGSGSWTRQLYILHTSVLRSQHARSYGLSVRCVRDYR